MSFFLSKSLEGRIAEEDLLNKESEVIYEDVKEDILPLSIKVNDASFEIKRLEKDRMTLSLDFTGYKNYSNLIDKSDIVEFYIFDDMLFSKKTKDLFIERYEKLTSNLIKLDIIIN